MDSLKTNRSERKHKAVGSPKPEKVPEKRERYIVFIGNLPFSSTKEDVEEHFTNFGGLIEFRLLTKREGGSKGCGFLEFDNVASQQKALRFHHTTFQGRKINVEATCGGGGHSSSRKEKIKSKNQKIREKIKKKAKASDTKREKKTHTDDKHSDLLESADDSPLMNDTEAKEETDGLKGKWRKVDKTLRRSDDATKQTEKHEQSMVAEISPKKRKKKKHKVTESNKQEESSADENTLNLQVTGTEDDEQGKKDVKVKKRKLDKSNEGPGESKMQEYSGEMIMAEERSPKKKKKKHEHKEQDMDKIDEADEKARGAPSDFDNEESQNHKKKKKRSKEESQSSDVLEDAASPSAASLSHINNSLHASDVQKKKKKKKKRHQTETL